MKLELKHEDQILGTIDLPSELLKQELGLSELNKSLELQTENLVSPKLDELTKAVETLLEHYKISQKALSENEDVVLKRKGAEEFVEDFEKHDIRGFEPLVARIFNTLKNDDLLKQQKELVDELSPETNEPQAETEETLIGGIMLDIIDHADPEHGYFPWVEKGKYARVIVSGEE